MLGDVIAIRDEYGEVVASYKYDAWGNHTVYNQYGGRDYSASSIGNINPFRYRGYYYDTETGFYYLQTRYYDPTICRFINADNYELVADLASVPGQLNMYAYCGNNPVMYTDPTGTDWDWNEFWGWIVAGSIAVLSVAAIAVVACGVVASGGLLGGVLVGTGAGSLLGMGGSIIAQGGFAIADPWKVSQAGAIGGMIGGISGASSWALGTIGQSIGQYIGFSLSNATHLSTGMKFGYVFGTQFLMNAGGLTGNIVGGLIGGTFANHQANRLFGSELTSKEIMEQGVVGESPLWAIRFFRWMFI